MAHVNQPPAILVLTAYEWRRALHRCCVGLDGEPRLQVFWHQSKCCSCVPTASPRRRGLFPALQTVQWRSRTRRRKREKAPLWGRRPPPRTPATARKGWWWRCVWLHLRLDDDDDDDVTTTFLSYCLNPNPASLFFPPLFNQQYEVRGVPQHTHLTLCAHRAHRTSLPHYLNASPSDGLVPPGPRHHPWRAQQVSRAAGGGAADWWWEDDHFFSSACHNILKVHISTTVGFGW